MSVEEIGCRVEQRLEELLEESTRLRAALEALGGEDARASRVLGAGRATNPGVETVSRNRPAKPRRAPAVTTGEPDAVDGRDATEDSPAQRAIRQLRQELAAGLRNR